MNMKVGQVVMSGPTAEPVEGNALPLKNIPLSLSVHNIEMRPGSGAKLVRGAGLGAQIMSREGDYADIKLPSGEIRRIHVNCYATVGQVGNLDHQNVSSGKAGRSRWKGIRPTVRGVAMNPIDHVMGGGEGRSSGGGHPRSPWGQLAKGKKTRHKKKTSSRFIVQRRK
jgi:large subunit ribosomal protein L2